VEVKIGVQNAPRELVVESDQNADEIEQAVRQAFNSKANLLTLIDHRKRRVVIPVSRLAYLEIGESEDRRVGFGAM